MIEEFKWLLRERFNVSDRIAGAIVWGLLIILCLALFLGLKSCYDNSVVENATNEANSEFQQDKDEATGKADKSSDDRRAEHETKVRRTEDLIDEALAKGCVIADYLDSNGAECVRPDYSVSGAGS